MPTKKTNRDEMFSELLNSEGIKNVLNGFSEYLKEKGKNELILAEKNNEKVLTILKIRVSYSNTRYWQDLLKTGLLLVVVLLLKFITDMDNGVVVALVSSIIGNALPRTIKTQGKGS